MRGEFAFKVNIVDVVEEGEFDAYVGRRVLTFVYTRNLILLKASQAPLIAARK